MQTNNLSKKSKFFSLLVFIFIFSISNINIRIYGDGKLQTALHVCEDGDRGQNISEKEKSEQLSKELKDAKAKGTTVKLLKSINPAITPKHFKQAGYDAKALKDAGFTLANLKDAEYPEQELKELFPEEFKANDVAQTPGTGTTTGATTTTGTGTTPTGSVDIKTIVKETNLGEIKDKENETILAAVKAKNSGFSSANFEVTNVTDKEATIKPKDNQNIQKEIKVNYTLKATETKAETHTTKQESNTTIENLVYGILAFLVFLSIIVTFLYFKNQNKNK